VSILHTKKAESEEASYFDMWKHKRVADAKRNDWILVQYRKFNDSNTDEFQTANWDRYQNGFGDPEENLYWMGLERMHHMTSSGSWKLLLVVEGERPDYMFNFVIFDNVTVASKQDYYRLKLGSVEEKYGKFEEFSRTKLMEYNGMYFSTPDHDHDAHSSYHCAKNLYGGGGWWYTNCGSEYFPNVDRSHVLYSIGPASATKMGLRRVL